MRRTIVILGTVLALTMLAIPALATEADEVAFSLETRRYYIEPGSDADFEDLERLVDEWPNVYFVVLAADVASGADLFAAAVIETLGVDGTVVVVTPGEVGAVSTVYEGSVTDRALDALLDDIDTGYYEGFTSFAAALDPSTAPAVTTGSGSSSGGAGGGGFIFLLIIVVVGVGIFFLVRRSNRNREEQHQDRLGEIKTEIQAQLSEAANDILELEDDVLLSDNEQAKELYYSGSSAYSQFQDQLASAQSYADLDRLAEGADHALWQLESAEALIEGRQPPAKPEPRPGFEPPPPPPAPEPRRQELPEQLQIRRERRASRGTRERSRSSGGLGGLASAAMILKTLEQGRSPRIGTSAPARVATSTSRSSASRPRSSTKSTSSKSRSASSSRSSSSSPRIKGRSRKRR